MNHEAAKIKDRLEEVLESIFCPVGGCWGLHGGHYEYYYDEGCECHALEVWPAGFQEAEKEGSNGRQRDDEGICYEFAEFEFGKMVKEVPLKHLHFSQRRQVFEVGWKEDGQDLELRIHIMPVEVECV